MLPAEAQGDCCEGDLGGKPGSSLQLSSGSLGMGWKRVGRQAPSSLPLGCFPPFSFGRFACDTSAGLAAAGQIPGAEDGTEPGGMDRASKTQKSYAETHLISLCDPELIVPLYWLRILV